MLTFQLALYIHHTSGCSVVDDIYLHSSHSYLSSQRLIHLSPSCILNCLEYKQVFLKGFWHKGSVSMLRFRHRLKKFKKIKTLRRQRFRNRSFYSENRMFNMKNVKVVVLTGAGISAESGIKTFRSTDGLWEEHRVEDVATPEGFARDPQLVQSFYNERRRQLQQDSIKPNSAHYALAQLEDLLGDNFLLVTQNIDNLHERAGSKRIIHMHGELLKVRCSWSNQVVEWKGDLSVTERCHCCQFPQPLRPHIVWFGEMPIGMDQIYQAIEGATIFIAIGTSGHVYPAAGFVHEAKLNGAHTVELNLEPSQVESEFDEKHYGLASKVVVDYINHLITELSMTSDSH